METNKLETPMVSCKLALHVMVGERNIEPVQAVGEVEKNLGFAASAMVLAKFILTKTNQ